MKSALLHLAGTVFDSPLAIIPAKLEAILRAVGPRLVLDQSAIHDLIDRGDLRIYDGGRLAFADTPVPTSPAGQPPKPDKGYVCTDSGIAIIPIHGTLMKSGGWMSAASGCSSYQGVRAAFDCALDDAKVRAILFDVDSPGGTTHGCFELSDYIRSCRGRKPMCACANDLAASAAFALASAADSLWVTSTGAVGSVGVFALHVSQASLDDKTGLAYEYIKYGAKKTEGNPHEPLAKSARADMQAEVDRQGETFTACIAANRGADPNAIRDLEASVLFGAKSVPLLADEVGTFADTLAYLEGLLDKGVDRGVRGSASLGTGRTASLATMPAIPAHKTSTSTKSWDGPGNKRRLREDETTGYYRKAYAFQNPPPANPRTKAGYKFVHHEVSGDGSVGAANLRGCSSSIAVLNGGRSGTVLKAGDRKGTYNHVSAHLRDAGKDPSPLASYQSYLMGASTYAAEKSNPLLATEVATLLASTDFSVVDLDLESQTTAEKAEGAESMAKKTEPDEYMKKGKSKAESEKDEKAESAKKSEPEDDDEDKDEEPDDDEDDEKDEKKKKGKKATSASSDEDEDEEPPAKKKGESKGSPAVQPGKGKKAVAAAKDDDEDEDEEEPVEPAPKKKSTKANSAAREISDLCVIAGYSHLIPKYLAAGNSVDQVRHWLAKRRSAASAENPTNGNFSFGAPVGTSSLDRAIQQAKTMALNSGGKIAEADALARILAANPTIYEDYDEERRRVAQQGTNRDIAKYATAQQRTMKELGLSSEFGSPPAAMG